MPANLALETAPRGISRGRRPIEIAVKSICTITPGRVTPIAEQAALVQLRSEHLLAA